MITLYNPHVDDFLAEPPHFRLLKRRALKKYGFFIPGELARVGEVRILVDGTISAFVPEKYFILLPAIFRNGIASIEFALWHKINKFDQRVKRVEAPTSPVDDVLLVFSYKAATSGFPLRKALLSKYKAIVFHLSHYFVSTGEKAKNISKLDNAWLAGDSDISDNPYFRHFFFWYRRDFLVLSFSVATRFREIHEFNVRQPRCIATGSFHDLTHEIPAEKYTDYISVTGFSTYHPIRKTLYECAAEISESIVCKISPYRPIEKVSKLKRLLRHFSVAQKNYFAINIVELYNNYQCAVVGEELSGFPALGSFEAMACGCILIGEPSAYAGMGLVAGVHFVPHDGTLKSVIQAVKLVVSMDDGARLSRRGQGFIKKNFRPETVYKKWISTLEVLQSDDVASISFKEGSS